MMMTSCPKTFRGALEVFAFPADAPACPHAVFMVEPENFRVDPESGADNRYLDLDTGADPDRALRQSRNLARAVRERGIEVVSFPGDAEAPDGVFPNNVFATVPGRLIVGSMRHPGRRREADRTDIRAYFAQKGYETVDLSASACIAELTGPLVLDRARGIGFCGMTERVDSAGARAMHDAFGLRLMFTFDLVPDEYHTNVVLSVLAGRAVVLCPDSFADPAVPEAIAAAFPQRALFIDTAEKDAFAGNCIALTDKDLFMSRSGADALRPTHRRLLEAWGFDLCSVELDEIEKAGGSLRCMLAEIF